MAQVTYRHGEPTMVDYTPSADVSAGDVVLLGNTAGLTCGVVHVDIANAVQGAISAGGGVYDAINLNNAANYAKVWWDDSANQVTTTSTNNALFGFVVDSGGGGANSTCRVLHKPYV
jgi:predicted RecA/RadA family phage recombinase